MVFVAVLFLCAAAGFVGTLWLLPQRDKIGESAQVAKVPLVQRSPEEIARNDRESLRAIADARDAMAAGRKDEALTAYSKAIALSPEVGQPGLVFLERAQILMEMQRYKEALADLNNAIQRQSHPTYLQQRVVAALQSREYDIAAADMKTLRLKFEDDAGIQRFLAVVEQAWHTQLGARKR